MPFKFTTKALESLKPPPFIPAKDSQPINQQKFYWQGDGLGVRVSSTGAKSFVFKYRVPSGGTQKTRRDVLGEFSPTETGNDESITLREANEKVAEWRAAIQQGKDPRRIREQAEREQQIAQANTFLATAKKFLSVYKPKNKPNLRPRTLEEYTRHLLVDFAPLHDVPVRSITKQMVNEALDMIQQRVAGVGINRCFATLRLFFNWCSQRDFIDLPPTAAMEKRAPELSRERHLHGNADHNEPSEIALFWNACDEIGPAGAMPKLLLLTGQRRNEVAHMTRMELLDLDESNPRWLLPGDRTKNWKPNLIPLGPLAVETLRALPRNDGCKFVFSSDGTSAPTGYNALKRKIDAAAAVLKAKDPQRYAGQLQRPWRLHDLRRTVKTGLAALGIAGDIRDALLNHAPAQAMDRVYVHASYTPEKRAAMEQWEAQIRALIADHPASVEPGVIPITRKRRR